MTSVVVPGGCGTCADEQDPSGSDLDLRAAHRSPDAPRDNRLWWQAGRANRDAVRFRRGNSSAAGG
jgi:hypothetical protein